MAITRDVIARAEGKPYVKGIPFHEGVPMSHFQDLAQKYIAIWNESDPSRRRAAIAALYTDDCVYTDPNVALTGRDALDQFIGAVQKKFPGVLFALGGPVDGHHDQARFQWHASLPGTVEPVVIGFDVAVMAGGRIRSVLGFLDKSP
jgi:hypothetical protein